MNFLWRELNGLNTLFGLQPKASGHYLSRTFNSKASDEPNIGCGMQTLTSWISWGEHSVNVSIILCCLLQNKFYINNVNSTILNWHVNIVPTYSTHKVMLHDNSPCRSKNVDSMSSTLYLKQFYQISLKIPATAF